MTRTQKLVVAGLGLLIFCVFCMVAAVLIDRVAPSSSPQAVGTPAAQVPTAVANANTPTNIPVQSSTEIPPTLSSTNTPLPTSTSAPTNTSLPTSTPQPTDTPLPPTPTPKPIHLSGSGDKVVDFDNPFSVSLAHIKGNTGARFFAVTSYDSSGQMSDLLVNTTDPYDGVRPLDFLGSHHTTRLQVQATGPWTIDILPVTTAPHVTVPGTYKGKGDSVLAFSNTNGDTAHIQGNHGARFFAVTAYGNSIDLLVNTTDPYDGTVILPPETIVLEVQAVGEWSIEITAR